MLRGLRDCLLQFEILSRRMVFSCLVRELSSSCSHISIGNIPRILEGKPVFLFSPNLIVDLVIGLPHYIVLALVWIWFFKRYHLSVIQFALLIGLFWGIKVDQFQHFFALLSGNVLDFLVAASVVVWALTWPLLLMEEKIATQYPNRSTVWYRFTVAILV